MTAFPPGAPSGNWRSVDLGRDYGYDETRLSPRADAFVKGMFFDDPLQILRRHDQPWPRSYLAFKDYSEVDYNEVVVAAAKVAFPSLTPRRALHALGLLAFPTLRQSLIGRVVFGVLGDDVRAVLGIAKKGYEIACSDVGVTLVESDVQRAVLAFDRCALPIEGYQLGVFEGAITACKHTPGPARVNLVTEYSGQVEVTWS